MNEILQFELDVDGIQKNIIAYVVESTYNYNIILGRTWLKEINGIFNEKENSFYSEVYDVTVRGLGSSYESQELQEVSAAAFQLLVRQSRKTPEIHVFAASIQDI